jgi:hypothetical protein
MEIQKINIADLYPNDGEKLTLSVNVDDPYNAFRSVLTQLLAARAAHKLQIPKQSKQNIPCQNTI